MSHEIETMAFVGETPWHGLGQTIDMEDAGDLRGFQVAAGLDWEVQLENNCKKNGDPIEDSYYIERTSDGSVLGKSVTDKYLPVQNSELFEFFRPYVEDGRLHIHTAGSLFSGQKVWVMASPMKGFTLDGNDEVTSNAIFTLDHTGRAANSMILSPVRVVCNNTMQLATKFATNEVRHNHKVGFDPKMMDEALNYFNAAFDDYELEAMEMAKRYLTGEETLDYFRGVFDSWPREKDGRTVEGHNVKKAMGLAVGKDTQIKTKGKSDKVKLAETKEAIERLMAEAAQTGRIMTADDLAAITSDDDTSDDTPVSINPGHDLDSARSDDGRLSVWVALQTVTHFVDHNPQKKYNSVDHKLQRAFYGPPAGQRDYKAAALEAARELVAA